MSDEMQNDPWADDATSIPEDADTIDWTNVGEGGDEFDDILDGLNLEETESDEVIYVRDDSAKKYDDPRDVGLKTGMWVPVRILGAEVREKHVPRLDKRACIAKKDGKVVGVLFDDVEKAVKSGAEEVIGEFPLPHFVCTANHAAPRFGQRRFDWEIEVPVFTIKTAVYRPRPGGNSGFPNRKGESLRKATGATAAGDKISRANMHEVAEKMVDTIVLAQVSVVQAKKKRPRPRLDADNNPIMVKVDPESGEFITVLQDGSTYIVENTGEIWEGDEASLVSVESNRYAILDNSDYAAPLTEEYTPWNDYINPPFLPMPERKVKVARAQGEGGEPVYDEGEITLDTVGAIARGNTAGTQVDILLHTGENMGKIITATWLGTEWVELPAPKANENDATDEGDATDDREQEQDKVLASM